MSWRALRQGADGDGRRNVSLSGPLSGIRVVEWAHVHFGPGAGMFLSDMGADVIHVETPDRRRDAPLPDALGRRVPARPRPEHVHRGHPPQQAEPDRRPPARGGARDRSAPRRRRRRLHHELPPAGGGEERARPRDAARPQPAARLRARDELRPGRPRQGRPGARDDGSREGRDHARVRGRRRGARLPDDGAQRPARRDRAPRRDPLGARRAGAHR